jgi:hypothetical protein
MRMSGQGGRARQAGVVSPSAPRTRTARISVSWSVSSTCREICSQVKRNLPLLSASHSLSRPWRPAVVSYPIPTVMVPTAVNCTVPARHVAPAWHGRRDVTRQAVGPAACQQDRRRRTGKPAKWTDFGNQRSFCWYHWFRHKMACVPWAAVARGAAT